MISFIVKKYLLQTEQILAEYKVLALQYHPDKNDGDKEAESKFQLMKVKIHYYLIFLLLHEKIFYVIFFT